MENKDGAGHEYPIKRTSRSSARLNLNHLLMKDVAGYLIHPTIPTDKPDLTIADVGTGTAAWVLDVASRLPQAKVDGFDISDEQYSPLFGMENVFLTTHNCFDPFPEEYQGKYDIVHVRFWLCSVNVPDAPLLLKNLMALLKPGGYIQWFEPLAMDVKVWKRGQNILTPELDKHCLIYQKPRPNSTLEWVENLPTIFNGAGLEVVAADRHPIRDAQRAIWGQSNLMGLRDTVDEKAGHLDGSTQIEQFANKLEVEMKNGAGLDMAFFSVVGKLPA